MCFLQPLQVKKIEGKKVFFKKNIIAYYDKKVGQLKKNDWVLVFGNLIIKKINGKKS